jgi:hypothetical protein
MNQKHSIALALSLSIGVVALAGAESLSTADGTTYNNITSKRVDPDGIYIEYTPAGGGMGMSKVKFSRLSDDQRKQFGYDEAKAKEYSAQYAKGMEQWRADNVKMEQESRARIAADQAQAIQAETLENQHILALAQLKQAEAELARAKAGNDNGANGYGGYASLGDSGFAFAIPQTGRVVPATTDFAPIARSFVGVDNQRPHITRTVTARAH